jgi:hypothetical protein
MWLLDANKPVQLVSLLKELGIEADSAVRAVGTRSAMATLWMRLCRRNSPPF